MKRGKEARRPSEPALQPAVKRVPKGSSAMDTKLHKQGAHGRVMSDTEKQAKWRHGFSPWSRNFHAWDVAIRKRKEKRAKPGGQEGLRNAGHTRAVLGPQPNCRSARPQRCPGEGHPSEVTSRWSQGGRAASDSCFLSASWVSLIFCTEHV